MSDYKQMYLRLFRATEAAISVLIAAQQECEELYINSSGTELQILVPFVLPGDTPSEG